MLVKSQELRVEGQKHVLALRSCSGPRLLTLRSRLSPRGVTLIELLIVIMIISILAALVLGVAAVAGETARQAQTRHLVERLHTLMTEHYNSYKTRRVKLNPAVETAIANALKTSTAAVRGGVTAEARLYAMRELMLMEVPDRWSDVLLADVGLGTTGNTTAGSPVYLNGRTDLSNVYLRRYRELANRTNSITGAINTAEEIKLNQGAECLYLFITLACGDGEARSLFKEADIGDSDGDGAPEFLDGWGHPINFLRWAPGFDSQIELNQDTIDQMVNGGQVAEAKKEIAKDHDPFDIYRVEGHAFRLVPLIYSAGRDGDAGINIGTDYVTWPKPTTFKVNTSTPYLTPRLTPYDLDTYSAPYSLTDYLGKSLHVIDKPNNYANYPDETSVDNVHNHLLGQR